jgi:hypothetical protein
VPWGIGLPRRLDVAARRHQLRLRLMANQDSVHTGAIACYGNKRRYGTISHNGSAVREGRQPILLARGHSEPRPRHSRPHPSGQGLSVVHGPQPKGSQASDAGSKTRGSGTAADWASSTHHVRHRDPSGLSLLLDGVAWDDSAPFWCAAWTPAVGRTAWERFFHDG